MSRVTVVGAGSWGTALASVLAKNGHEVRVWALEEEVVTALNERRRNPLYLPDIDLPEVYATRDLAEALDGSELAVSVTPAQHARSVWTEGAAHLAPDTIVLSASKGIELKTLLRMDQVFGEILPDEVMARFSVISGPSFAVEVAREAPTAVVAASADEAARRRVQALFQTRFFRVYTAPDVIGVELGGALKNVVALGAGVAAGLGFGHNTMAALITRGLAEITRLGLAMGARRETFSGLAGMGDLVLTCTGELSRNRTVGFRLGRGETLEEILSEMRAVAEGVETVRAVRDLSRRHGVEMPITDEVYAMLVDARPPRQALENLMSREPKPEEWS